MKNCWSSSWPAPMTAPGRVYGYCRPAWRDGSGGLSPCAGQPPRGRRCFPGHVPRVGAEASEIAKREQLACWLYGVARAPRWTPEPDPRQHAKEIRLGIMLPADRIDEIHKVELRSILDEALGCLPERHRAAIVLCELEGLTRREAADRLGISQGTLSSRLARAKTRLRERLIRRGVILSAATLATALMRDAQAVTVSPSLSDSTIRVATMVATGSSLAGVAPSSVVTLTEGVLKAMLLSKLKLAFVGLLSVAFVTTGAGVIAQDRPSGDDRLKNLERKVDRLLEVLGGSNRRTPSPDTAPDSRAVPAATTPALVATPAAPAAPPAIAAVPRPPQPPATPRAPASSPFPTPSPAITNLPPSEQPQIALPGMAPSAHPGQPNSLARRVDSLEQRLAKLEQRMAEFERRLNGVNSALPPSPTSRNVLSVRRPAQVDPPAYVQPGVAAPTVIAVPAGGIPPDDVPPSPPGTVGPASVPAGAALPAPATEPAAPEVRVGDISFKGVQPPSLPAAPRKVPEEN